MNTMTATEIFAVLAQAGGLGFALGITYGAIMRFYNQAVS